MIRPIGSSTPKKVTTKILDLAIYSIEPLIITSGNPILRLTPSYNSIAILHDDNSHNSINVSDPFVLYLAHQLKQYSKCITHKPQSISHTTSVCNYLYPNMHT